MGGRGSLDAAVPLAVCALPPMTPRVPLAGSGSNAFADGIGAAASFNQPQGVAVSPDGLTVYVADWWNNRVREVLTPVSPPAPSPTDRGVARSRRRTLQRQVCRTSRVANPALLCMTLIVNRGSLI